MIAAAAVSPKASHPSDELFALAFNDNVKSACRPRPRSRAMSPSCKMPYEDDSRVWAYGIIRRHRAGLDTSAVAAQRRVLVIVSDAETMPSHDL